MDVARCALAVVLVLLLFSDDVAAQQPAEASTQPVTGASKTTIEAKLKDTDLSLDFEGAPIEMMIGFLTAESQRVDSRHQALNFVVLSEAISEAKPVTLELKKASLGQALQLICQQAGIRYEVGKEAIYIVPLSQNLDDLRIHESLPVPTTDAGRAMLAKLQTIVMDEVNFEKLDVAIALRYFAQRSRYLDPDRKGVNFVLGTITAQDSVQREVSLKLENMPLDEVLAAVALQTHLRCVVEGDAVYFRP